MNAPGKIRNSRLILAVLGAAATVGLSLQLSSGQAANPRPGANPRLDGPGSLPPQGPPDGRGDPRPGDGARAGDGPPRHRGPRRETPPPPRQTVQLSGSVVNYNFGPRGNVDSLMIKSGDKIVQINLPPLLAPVVAQQAAIGNQVKITASPEMGLPDHAVYELQALTSEQGREIRLPSPDDRKFIHEESTVKSLNYAHHGEVDGVLLDNGDFVHIGPAAESLKITVSQKITVDGIGRPMLTSEHHAVQAMAINGNIIEPAVRPPEAEGGPSPRGEGDQMPSDGWRGRGRGGPGRQSGPDGPPQAPDGQGGSPQGIDGPPRGPQGPNGPGGPGPRPGRERGQQRGGPDEGPGKADAPRPPAGPDRDGIRPPPHQGGDQTQTPPTPID